MIAQPAPVAVEKPLPATPVVVEPEAPEAIPVPAARRDAAPAHVHVTNTAGLVAVAGDQCAGYKPRRTGPAFLVVAVDPTVAVDWDTAIPTASLSTCPGSAVGADSLSASARNRAMATTTFARLADCSVTSTASTAAAVDATQVRSGLQRHRFFSGRHR